MKKLSHGCTLDCADACKFNIYVKDNKIEKIEGDKEHPYTKGFICKKGIAHLNRLTHKDRIKTPLLKIDGEWKEISFEEAIGIMEEMLSYYKNKYSSKSIFYYEQYGSGSILKSIGEVFFNFYGGVTKSKGGPCWSAGIKAQERDFGYVKSHSLEDMINSKNIFVWGKNPAYTTIHTMQMIKKAQKNGSKIIVIDPIYTATAKMADKYIRINPGTDEDLALAIGKIIIEDNIYDKDFVNLYVKDFNNYKSYVKSLDINKLCNKCGVSIDEARELAYLYNSKYSTILLGYGIQKYKNGGSTIRFIDALGAITGQIGFSGGGVNYANKVYPDVLNGDPYNSSDYGKDRLFYVSDISKFINEAINGETYYKDNIYVKDIKTENLKNIYKLDIPIKMAIITKSNMLNQLPDLNNLKDAFSKIEFKVCFDMFMTDTAKECDLFIPCTNTLESEDIIYSSMTNPYITYNEKVVNPSEVLMDEYYFFRELAKKMNIIDYPYVDKKEYLNKVIAPLKEFYRDMTLENLKDRYITIHKEIPWEDKEFLTPSKKFEIHYRKDFKVDKEVVKKDVFRFLTNHHRDSLSSQHLMDEEGISKVYINENMANGLGLKCGEKVKLESITGSIEVEVNINNDVSDYVVMMYVGWWEKHGNPNFITSSGISDIGGQITYNESFVTLVKL
ncbi:molybdopterin-dependent oxidoreductase [Clostridium septicum]|uniref:molybdopterin-dependent oxidoreductase n=1 Tax=Clostridium septicum TaxID=1504 RepID=UPI00082DC10E|nr:molybdopterin-dependent oxidoreductase [Clostridium septicum]